MPMKIASSSDTETDIQSALGNARSVVHDGKKETTTEVVEPAEGDKPSETASAPSGGDGKTGEEPQAPKKKTGIQRRIDKLAKRVGDAERKAEYWENEVKRIQAQPRPADPKTTVDPSAKPKADQFENHADYQEAIALWAAKKESDRVKSELVKTMREAEVGKAGSEQARDYGKKEREFKKAHPDFEDRVSAVDGVKMPEWVEKEVLEAGPELAYVLAEDPEKFQEICSLPERAAVRQIGKILAKMEAPSTPEPEPVKPKPKPVQPVGSRAAVAPNYETFSMRQYDAWRRAGNSPERT